MGAVPEIIEAIAYVKFLNKEFGYALTVPEFLSPDSIWDEHHLDWHITYASTFNDPDLRTKARKHYDFFRRKGIFSAVYELASEPEPEPDKPVKVETPNEE